MSVLEALKPIYSILPEVRAPEKKGGLKQRLTWTGIVLLVFFAMGTIELVGLSKTTLGQLEQAQVILAASAGTLITVGIGPIVLASIILQLMIGGGLIKLDFGNPAERAQFAGVQKLLAIILSFIEASVYVLTGFLTPVPGMGLIVILQVALGAIILLYLDEVVSKYGIGSGVGLFIAGGVAQEIIWRIFTPFSVDGSLAGLGGAGLLYTFLAEVGTNVYNAFVSSLFPIIATIAVFMAAVYAEGIHVNIPITMGRKGTGGRYPVKFLYVSNMPVILASALFINISIWANLLKGIPILGGFLNGLSAVVLAPRSLVEQLLLEGFSGQVIGQFFESIVKFQFIGLGGEVLHGIIYVLVLTIVCVIFGRLWIEVGGQGPDRIAEQLTRAGMSIPGFRNDPRVIRQVLDRYVPTITILGSAFVGILAGFADLTGAIGSGTGILLAAGIIYRLYEELAKMQLAETNPLLQGFFGGQGGGF